MPRSRERLRPVTMNLPDDVIDGLDAAAGKVGESRQGLVAAIVRKWISEEGKQQCEQQSSMGADIQGK